jgi:hypothetical protein
MNAPRVEPSTKKAFNFPKGTSAKPSAKKTGSKNSTQATSPNKAQPKPATVEKKVAKKSAEKPVTRAVKQAVEQEAKEAASQAVAAQPEGKMKRAKKDSAKKEKVVRDSFTMPKSDYAKIAALKQKCLDNGLHARKSELLRAALTMLNDAPEKRIVAAVKALEVVKTGRPSKS